MREQWQSRKQTKEQILQRFLQYLRKRGDVQFEGEDLVTGLTQHFRLLPTRYALDVTTESLDILNHFNLLREARSDHSAVFFHVRPVEIQQNIAYVNQQSQRKPIAIVGTNFPITSSQPRDIPGNSALPRLPKPAFGSSPGLQALGQEMQEVDEVGVKEQYVQAFFWEVTVATVDQPRLLSKLTEALGDIGLSIREAHVFNTADGMALDVFVTEGWTIDGKDGLEQALGQRFGLLSPPPTMPPITEGVPQLMDADVHALKYFQSRQKSTPVNDWEIDANLLSLEEIIGKGQFGTLYRGQYCGQQVAVKIFKDINTNSQQYQEFQQEVSIMRKVRHKNVVQFIGACTQEPHLCIVFEFMSGGSIYDYIKQHGSLSVRQTLKVAVDVSHGMDYLHRMGIVHRDLKAANLLFDENFVAKIGDFGVARLLDGEGLMTAETGTYRWMAPEVIEHKPYGVKADVFSFGVVLSELLAGQVPYANMTPMQAAVGVVKGLRPSLPQNLPEQLQQLIQACWANQQDKRPTFAQLHTMLQRMYKQCTEVEQKGGKWGKKGKDGSGTIFGKKGG